MIQGTALPFISTEALRRPASTLQHVIPATHTVAQLKKHSTPLNTPEVYAASAAASHSVTALTQVDSKRLHSSRLSFTCQGTRKIMEQRFSSHAALNVPMPQSADIFVGCKSRRFPSKYKPVNAVQWSPAKLRPPLPGSGFPGSPSSVAEGQWVCGQPVKKQREDSQTSFTVKTSTTTEEFYIL